MPITDSASTPSLEEKWAMQERFSMGRHHPYDMTPRVSMLALIKTSQSPDIILSLAPILHYHLV
jgi:hypothetical protein